MPPPEGRCPQRCVIAVSVDAISLLRLPPARGPTLGPAVQQASTFRITVATHRAQYNRDSVQLLALDSSGLYKSGWTFWGFRHLHPQRLRLSLSGVRTPMGLSDEERTGVSEVSVEPAGGVQGFGDFVAVREMDLDIAEGEFFTHARPVGLRQDDDPADDRRLRAADRRARSRSTATTSPGCRPTSARPTPSSRATRSSPT